MKSREVLKCLNPQPGESVASGFSFRMPKNAINALIPNTANSLKVLLNSIFSRLMPNTKYARAPIRPMERLPMVVARNVVGFSLRVKYLAVPPRNPPATENNRKNHGKIKLICNVLDWASDEVAVSETFPSPSDLR